MFETTSRPSGATLERAHHRAGRAQSIRAASLRWRRRASHLIDAARQKVLVQKREAAPDGRGDGRGPLLSLDRGTR